MSSVPVIEALPKIYLTGSYSPQSFIRVFWMLLLPELYFDIIINSNLNELMSFMPTFSKWRLVE